MTEQRQQAELLGEIREVIFGAQDGIISTLVVVSAVGSATNSQSLTLVAGVASAFAGMLSMATGEYLSSKSQREVYLAQIQKERREVSMRPGEAQAEVAYILEREGLQPPSAERVAAYLAKTPNALLRTMVEKELGIRMDERRGALHGAVTIAAAFALGSIVPVLPYLLMPIAGAVWVSIGLSASVLFAIGVAKSRWTLRNPVRSGSEVVALALVAGTTGYLFGVFLPALLGVRATS